MTPAEFALQVYRGDTYSWSFALWENIERTQPVDLTGATAKAEIRAKPGGELWVDMPLTVTLPNIIVADLSADDSRKLVSKLGAWDLQLTLDDGTVATVIAGGVFVTPDTTDSVFDAP
jgi:hypothetical protein